MKQHNRAPARNSAPTMGTANQKSFLIPPKLASKNSKLNVANPMGFVQNSSYAIPTRRKSTTAHAPLKTLTRSKSTLNLAQKSTPNPAFVPPAGRKSEPQLRLTSIGGNCKVSPGLSKEAPGPSSAGWGEFFTGVYSNFMPGATTGKDLRGGPEKSRQVSEASDFSRKSGAESESSESSDSSSSSSTESIDLDEGATLVDIPTEIIDLSNRVWVENWKKIKPKVTQAIEECKTEKSIYQTDPSLKNEIPEAKLVKRRRRWRFFGPKTKKEKLRWKKGGAKTAKKSQMRNKKSKPTKPPKKAPKAKSANTGLDSKISKKRFSLPSIFRKSSRSQVQETPSKKLSAPVKTAKKGDEPSKFMKFLKKKRKSDGN